MKERGVFTLLPSYNMQQRAGSAGSALALRNDALCVRMLSHPSRAHTSKTSRDQGQVLDLTLTRDASLSP